jgi:hypothetical protein
MGFEIIEIDSVSILKISQGIETNGLFLKPKPMFSHKFKQLHNFDFSQCWVNISISIYKLGFAINFFQFVHWI